MARNTTLRIGVLGLTHDHIWSNLDELRGVRGAHLVAVADPNSPLVDRAVKDYGCTGYPDHKSLLAAEELDAVYLYSDNFTGVELGIAAAEKGLHLLVEKPMAASLDGADRLLAAVRRAGVRCMINWPITWLPQLQRGLDLALSGKIGEIWQVKYRAAHAGPREMGCSPYFCDWLYDPRLNGGGALVDYCCYGAVLARVLLGLPSRVTGVSQRCRKEDILVEDNGVLIMSYPNGLSISEASWTQLGYFQTYAPAIFGTKGSLLVEPGPDGKLSLATAKNPMGVEVKVPRPPTHRRNASAHFVHCLRTGDEFLALGDDRICRDTQEILEAGLLSARGGGEVSLPLATY